MGRLFVYVCHERRRRSLHRLFAPSALTSPSFCAVGARSSSFCAVGAYFTVFSRRGSLRALGALDHDPSLQLGDRRMLLDLHDIADRARVALVMRVVFFGAAHRLLHDRVRKPAFDPHHDGLRLLVAHHFALQHPFRHLSAPQDKSVHLAVAARLPCAAVLMRAMSRRTSRTRDVFASCPVARWKRRLNCSFLSLMSSSSN